VREHVRSLNQTPEFVVARRARNKIEALFSELRNQIRLRKVRLRRSVLRERAVHVSGNSSEREAVDTVPEPNGKTNS
jgi:hypothetical protein